MANPLQPQIDALKTFANTHPVSHDFIGTGFAPASPGPVSGPTIGYNPPVGVSIGLPGGSGGGASSGGSIVGSIASNFFNNIFGGVGSQLLRLVLLILGLICIIGAIYLFKDTREIVAAPARAVRETAKAAAAGATAA